MLFLPHPLMPSWASFWTANKQLAFPFPIAAIVRTDHSARAFFRISSGSHHQPVFSPRCWPLLLHVGNIASNCYKPSVHPEHFEHQVLAGPFCPTLHPMMKNDSEGGVMELWVATCILEVDGKSGQPLVHPDSSNDETSASQYQWAESLWWSVLGGKH